MKAKEAVLKENLFHIRSAVNQYFADKGRYPADIQALVDDDYLMRMPKDPITESTDTWIEIPSEYDEQDISQEPGIADVQSGASGVALDGSAYQDW